MSTTGRPADALIYANTNVQVTTISWDETAGTSEDFFQFTRSGVPGTSVRASRALTQAGQLMSDQAGNRYWQVSPMIGGTTAPYRLRWTVQLE